jgi:hypothetical protein
VKHFVGGGLLAVLGAIVLAGALVSGNTSPRGWIGSHYTKIGNGVYRAPGPPLTVAAGLARKFRPSDRAYDPAGVFLRYPNTIVAVLPDGKGSRVLVDDLDRGYRRHHGYVGSRWGGPSGRASLFRGGGPGSGK